MAGSMRSLVLLGLVMAAFCVAADATLAQPSRKLDVGVDVKLNVRVALDINLKKCLHDVRVFVGVAVKGATCKAGALTVLKPVTAKLVVGELLNVDLEILGKKVAKVRVVIDLKKLKLVGKVKHIVLDLVEDVTTKNLVVLCLGVKLHEFNLLALGVVV